MKPRPQPSSVFASSKDCCRPIEPPESPVFDQKERRDCVVPAVWGICGIVNRRSRPIALALVMTHWESSPVAARQHPRDRGWIVRRCAIAIGLLVSLGSAAWSTAQEVSIAAIDQRIHAGELDQAVEAARQIARAEAAPSGTPMLLARLALSLIHI